MPSRPLSRSILESVVLFTNDDEQVVITVGVIEGDQVTLNFDAPECWYLAG